MALPLSHAISPSDRAPGFMADLGACGADAMSDRIRVLIRKRQDVKDQISVLRARHRKRAPLIRLLQKLTTQQLFAELRWLRKQQRVA